MSDTTYNPSQEIYTDGPSTTGHLSKYFSWVLLALAASTGLGEMTSGHIKASLAQQQQGGSWELRRARCSAWEATRGLTGLPFSTWLNRLQLAEASLTCFRSPWVISEPSLSFY